MKLGLLYLDALQDGGYPRDVRWLAGALAESGLTVRLVARAGIARDGLGSATVIGPDDFRTFAGDLDLVHLWTYFMPDQLRLFRRSWKSRPYVISPAGHLMAPHLRRRWWKKVPYVYGLAPIFAMTKERHFAHFFSKDEADRRARRLLQATGQFEASLGVFPPPPAVQARFGGDRLGDYLLFLGRNDIYQKGLDVLLAGYAEAVERGLELPLRIAGQSYDGSATALRRMVSELHLAGRVELMGEVRESDKWDLLANARCIVFLSRWDGPPRPVREAIAVGTPSIVSAGTNLAGIVRDTGAGASVDLTRRDVARGLLRSADEATAASWREGVARARQALRWPVVADQYRLGYERTLERTV
jgi:glycosyltransferase involved in cell wall biosynthesis